MSWLTVDGGVVADAATGLSSAGSVLQQSVQGAAAAMTQVSPPAIDAVSAVTAAVFGSHGARFQGISAEAQQTYQKFTQALGRAGAVYQQTELGGMQMLRDGVGQLEQPLVPAIQQLLPWSVNPTNVPAIPTTTPRLGIGIGGTTYPLLSPGLLSEATGVYFPSQVPVFGLFTPEQFWPLTPQLGNLTLGQSIAQGTAMLNAALQPQLAAGNHVTVFGVSQSATIVSNEIRALVAQGAPGRSLLNFVLAGDPSNPDGGILERFTGGYIPGLDIPFSGATPSAPYPLTVYTAQYDGFADFPRYVLNPVSDLNAAMGAFYVHGPAYGSPSVVNNAVQLPTNGGTGQYFMELTQNLPLLGPIRGLPSPYGAAVSDLLTPDLRVLVDAGYGSGEYANLPTPGNLLEFPRWGHVIPDLLHGAGQGARAAGVDLGLLPASDFPAGYPFNPAPDPQLNWPLPQTGASGLSRLTTFEGNLTKILGLQPSWDQ